MIKQCSNEIGDLSPMISNVVSQQHVQLRIDEADSFLHEIPQILSRQIRTARDQNVVINRIENG
jgi:hypothetical protein